MSAYPDYGLNWGSFVGDAACLKWNRKNMATLASVFEQYVTAHNTVVQAGGNLGTFPKWLATRFARVVTFEPDPDNFGFMCRNAPDNNIIKIQAALGFERQSVGMAKVNDWGRSHAGVTHVSGSGLIPTIRLDDLGLDGVDFIQLDTEGYELEAFKGAVETIVRCKPVIMAEINKNATLRGWSTADVLALIGDTHERVAQLGPDKIFVPRST